MQKRKQVTFATSCWEKDWKIVLLDPNYLKERQIANHQFPFFESLLILNNIEDLESAKKAAQKWVEEKVLTRWMVAQNVLEHFGLSRGDFDDWQYYNALGPLNAIFEAKGEYLLYQTGDAALPKSVSWIDQAICFMGKKENIKVANLTWNENYKEAKKESYRSTWNFFVAKEGFSDQMFLMKAEDLKKPMYGEVRSDASHYPRGDVLEKRIFSYMKNRGWERITFKKGSYNHEDGNFFQKQP